MTTRILVIHNPVAGRRRQKRVRELIQLLEARYFEVQQKPTAKSGDARRAAFEADGVDYIIAAGGDGTVNEVVDGLCARESETALPVVGFLPMGTANVLALELSLPKSPVGLVQLIEKGKTISLRPGVANNRRFVLMVSAGLDARAISCVNLRTKKWIGGAAYVFAALKAIAMPTPPLHVTIDGKEFKADTIIIARARCYGGPFQLTAKAGLTTSHLSVVMLKSNGFLSVLRYGFALVLGRLDRLADVDVRTGSEVSVVGPKEEPVQMDGDLVTHLPLSASLEKRVVSFLVP